MDQRTLSATGMVARFAGLLVYAPGLVFVASMLYVYGLLAPIDAPLNSPFTLLALFLLFVFITTPLRHANPHLIFHPRAAIQAPFTLFLTCFAIFVVSLLTAGVLHLLFSIAWNSPPPGPLRFLVPLAAAWLTMPLVYFVVDNIGPAASTVVRGRDLLADAEVERRIEELRNREGAQSAVQQRAPEYFWGGKLVPASTFVPDPHFLLLGTAGSGKTTLLKALMHSVLWRKAGNSGVRAMVYDPKLELYPYLLGLGVPSQDIVILNPFDVRTTPWDIAGDVETHADADELAATLIPGNPRESNPYFTNAARVIVAAVIKGLLERGKTWDLRDLTEILNSKTRLEKFLSQSEVGRRTLQAQLKQAAETASNVLSTLQVALASLETPAHLWHKAKLNGAQPRTIRQWANSKNSVLLLTMNADAAHSLRPLYCTFFSRATHYLLKKPEHTPDRSWLFFDEARDLEFMHGLEEMLRRGRSKSTHVVLGFQDVPAVKAAYDEQRALSILAGCQNLAALRVEGRETAEYLAGRFGRHEYWKRQFGSGTDAQGKGSTSISDNIDQRDVLLPDEFLALPSTQVAGGIPGAFIVPAVGPWGPKVVAFDQLNSLPKAVIDPTDARSTAGFKDVDPKLHRPTYWSAEEEQRFLDSSTGNAEQPPASGGADDAAQPGNPLIETDR